ncbi:hypothetical protein HanRHA438_Chr15g0731821 [Helianthus annuus]|nr:hypothetical protein HanRHA438_Chr15g0731821 [Helianthus annuus]
MLRCSCVAGFLMYHPYFCLKENRKTNRCLIFVYSQGLSCHFQCYHLLDSLI